MTQSKKQEKKGIKIINSLAGTDKPYAVGELVLKIAGRELPIGPVQVRVREMGSESTHLNIQIQGNPRSYGCTRLVYVKPKSLLVKGLPVEVKE